mgnify:FL=1
MSSRIYVKPDMKVIPLEGEGLTPLSANGIKIKVPDVISEQGVDADEACAKDFGSNIWETE